MSLSIFSNLSFATNSMANLNEFRMYERTGNVFILAGENIQIEIYKNGYWRFL